MILKFVYPNGQKRAVALDEKPITVGRSPDVDVVAEDKLMSRVHFGVSFVNNGYFVRDLKSRNGTFLNGERIEVARLQHGDKIKAGETVIVVEDPAAQAGGKRLGTETAIKELSAEMAQGKGYHTIMREITREEKKPPR